MKDYLLGVVVICALAAMSAHAGSDASDTAKVSFRWAEKIVTRDGVRLNATVYLPKPQTRPAPCIVTMTPYISQTYHDRGVYFAKHGLPFVTVDVRGRGNSEGEFRPFIQEARDGYDVVEWLAQQPFCNGKVATWGGSYAGYDQWALAKESPPHLQTIVPAAAVYPGLDFPMFNNMQGSYSLRWLTFTGGRALQDAIFADQAFWSSLQRDWFESGRPLSQFDAFVGHRSPVFQEWLRHPYIDDFDRFSFVSRTIARGGRLRLVLGPVNSMTTGKNYNSGGIVAEESMDDARPVDVRLFHDAAHPSALYLPLGQPQ